MWLWQTMTILIEKFAKNIYCTFFGLLTRHLFYAVGSMTKLDKGIGPAVKKIKGEGMDQCSIIWRCLTNFSPSPLLFSHTKMKYTNEIWPDRREERASHFCCCLLQQGKEPLGWKFSTEMPKCGGWVVSTAVTNSQTKIYKILRKLIFPHIKYGFKMFSFLFIFRRVSGGLPAVLPRPPQGHHGLCGRVGGGGVRGGKPGREGAVDKGRAHHG